MEPDRLPADVRDALGIPSAEPTLPANVTVEDRLALALADLLTCDRRPPAEDGT